MGALWQLGYVGWRESGVDSFSVDTAVLES